MRETRLRGFGQLDVREFLPADDFLLLLDRHRVPLVEVVKVFLDDYIAAAGEIGVFLADHGGVDGGLRDGIFRSVDETQQIAIIEVSEAMHLVRHRRGAAKPRHDLRRHLEAQVHARGANMEQQVARRGRRDARRGFRGKDAVPWVAAFRTAGPRRRTRSP